MVVVLTNALVSLQVGRLLVRLVAVWPFARVALHRFRVGGGVAVETPAAMANFDIYTHGRVVSGWHASAEFG
jgi:hypothetical protein